MNIKGLCIIAGAALLLGIPTGWPYSYYVLLRWLIFVVSVSVALGFYKSKFIAWALIFFAVGFLFNPLVPLYMSKSNWILTRTP